MQKALFYFLSAGVLLLFQNCSNVGFNSGKSSSDSAQTQNGGPGIDPDSTTNTHDGVFTQVQQGLKGGHFDLDTSSQVYLPSQGKTDRHIHEYDDKYNVTFADFFNLQDAKLGNISELVAPAKRFILTIANAELSPGGVLSINGQTESVVDYQKRVDAYLAGNSAALPVFTLNGASDIKLADLKIGFSADALAKGGLIGTVTGCVVSNNPGKLGEYRNGALVIQAIDVAAAKLNSKTRTAELNGGLLWESTLFWHWDNGCY